VVVLLTGSRTAFAQVDLTGIRANVGFPYPHQCRAMPTPATTSNGTGAKNSGIKAKFIHVTLEFDGIFSPLLSNCWQRSRNYAAEQQ
jgi:hypothetical protein